MVTIWTRPRNIAQIYGPSPAKILLFPSVIKTLSGGYFFSLEYDNGYLTAKKKNFLG